MAKPKDISGFRSGSLVALRRTEDRIRGCLAWECRCDCGTVIVVPGAEMRAGRYRSCGCMRKGGPADRSKHDLWNIYNGMINRCSNPKDKDFHRYGARGIEVCQRWVKDFFVFVNDVGKRPSPMHSIDRIDNDGPYSPGNTRWATPCMQSRNKRNNYVNGTTSVELAKATGVKPGTFRARMAKGWGIKRSLDNRDMRKTKGA